MESKKKNIPKLCEDCTHSEVCKYRENIEEKELEEPLEIKCKYKQLVFKYNMYPMDPFYKVKYNSDTNTAYSVCKNCCYLINGECKAPDNMAGLPCQTITCTCKA